MYDIHCAIFNTNCLISLNLINKFHKIYYRLYVCNSFIASYNYFYLRFFCIQISHMFENGWDCIGGFYRQNLLRRTPIKVLYFKIAKGMRETVLVG